MSFVFIPFTHVTATNISKLSEAMPSIIFHCTDIGPKRILNCSFSTCFVFFTNFSDPNSILTDWCISYTSNINSLNNLPLWIELCYRAYYKYVSQSVADSDRFTISSLLKDFVMLNFFPIYCLFCIFNMI